MMYMYVCVCVTAVKPKHLRVEDSKGATNLFVLKPARNAKKIEKLQYTEVI